MVKTAPPAGDEAHPCDGRLDAKALFAAFEAIGGPAVDRPTDFEPRAIRFGAHAIDVSSSVDPLAAFFARELERRGSRERWFTNPANRPFGVHVYLLRAEPIVSTIPWLAAFAPVAAR